MHSLMLHPQGGEADTLVARVKMPVIPRVGETLDVKLDSALTREADAPSRYARFRVEAVVYEVVNNYQVEEWMEPFDTENDACTIHVFVTPLDQDTQQYIERVVAARKKQGAAQAGG